MGSVGDALPEHGVGDLLESGDVGSGDQVAIHAVPLGRLGGLLVDGGHDALQLGVDLLEGPGEPGAVLAHLQCGSGDASCVGGLGGSEQDAGLLEGGDGPGRAGHVGSLGDGPDSVGDEDVGVLLVQLVLGGAGEGNVAGDGPDALALGVLGAGLADGVLLDPLPLDLLDVLDEVEVDSVGVVDVSVGVGDRRARGPSG